jgi:hypothetical protein
VEVVVAVKQFHKRGGCEGKIHGVGAEECRQGTQGCLGKVDRAGVVRIHEWTIVMDKKMLGTDVHGRVECRR